MFIITDKTKLRGKEVEGVGVMKDEDLKFEEIESSHTIGGTRVGEVVRGEGRGAGVDSTLLSYTLKYIRLTEVGRI